MAATAAAAESHTLFREVPSRETVIEWLNLIQITGFDDSHTFTERSFPFDAFNRILVEAEPYYYPCKARIYLHRDMTIKRVMTVLRQLVKPFGHTFLTHERLSAGKKYNEYYLSPEAPLTGGEPRTFAPLTFL